MWCLGLAASHSNNVGVFFLTLGPHVSICDALADLFWYICTAEKRVLFKLFINWKCKFNFGSQLHEHCAAPDSKDSCVRFQSFFEYILYVLLTWVVTITNQFHRHHDRRGPCNFGRSKSNLSRQQTVAIYIYVRMTSQEPRGPCPRARCKYRGICALFQQPNRRIWMHCIIHTYTYILWNDGRPWSKFCVSLVFIFRVKSARLNWFSTNRWCAWIYPAGDVYLWLHIGLVNIVEKMRRHIGPVNIARLSDSFRVARLSSD